MKKFIMSLVLAGFFSIIFFSSTQTAAASEISVDTDNAEVQNVPWRSWEGNYFLVNKSNPPETMFFKTQLHRKNYSGYLGRTRITDGMYTWYEGYVYLEGANRPITARVEAIE